jgi:PHD/YefM family antitoxin component YafN of YafNO toxin-antitoxin module
MITINSREFNQDVGRAKRATKDGPVIITDRGRQSHVLLSIEDYRRLSDRGAARIMSVADALAQPEAEADFAVEFPRSTDLPRPVELQLD